MKRVALMAGVNRYEDKVFRALRYSVADAVALATAFGKLGFETHVVTDPGNVELMKEVELRTSGLGPGDVFVFFFAGHGYTGPGGEHLLICRDDKLQFLRHNRAGVPVELLEETTNGKGFHRAFLLDACRTDVFSGMEGRGAAATRDLGLVALPDAGMNPGTCCVLRSCDRFCPALEFEDLGHGVFTRAVLDLLEGPEGTSVPMGETFAARVRERMRSILEREGSVAEQCPTFQTNGAMFSLFEEKDDGERSDHAEEQPPPVPVQTAENVGKPSMEEENVGASAPIPGMPFRVSDFIHRVGTTHFPGKSGSIGDVVVSLAGTIKEGGWRSKLGGHKGKLVVAVLVLLVVMGACWGRQGGRKGTTAARPASAVSATVPKTPEASKAASPSQGQAAASSATVPAAPRPRKKLTPEEREAAWRAEEQALADVRRTLETLQYEAGQTALQLTEFKRKETGLTSHIKKAAKAAKDIASAKLPATSAEGSNLLAQVSLARDALDQELTWLQENRPARDAALEAEQEIANTLDEGLVRYDAAKASSVKHARGTAARKAGKAALSDGNFTLASEKFAEARTLLSEALAEAQTFRAGTLVDDARKYRDGERWDECLAAASEALEAQPENADALGLKEEAERNLVPLLRVTAEANGNPVPGAVVSCNGESWGTTPTDRVLERGGGEYPLFLECDIDGTRHVGSLRIRAKVRGRTEAVVELHPEPPPGTERVIMLPNDVPMTLVWCPAGMFMMGSPREEEGRDSDEKQHHVTLTKGFWMAKTEVTQAQWKAVMGTTIRQQRNKESRSLPLCGEGDDYPMYYVNWEECEEFCRKAELRLPTEAEWEYACRAGTTGAYGGTGKLAEMGWFIGNSGEQARPVGEQAPNGWGLRDMHGNVSEWCQDQRNEKSAYADRAVTDPLGVASGWLRVLRGGSHSCGPQACRSADRASCDSDDRSTTCGFRPVCGQD